MPTGEHESPIELVKIEPGLMVWPASQCNVPVPIYHHARLSATDVRVVVPATYHIDTVVAFCDADDRPRLAMVWEPQRSDDADKLRAWKLYTVELEKELDVPCVLFVYCPDPADAQSYRRMIEADRLSSVPLRPVFVTPGDIPLITDVGQARANPAAAVFSALCHSRDPQIDRIFPALSEALQTVGLNRATAHHDIVLAGLPMPARERWESFMTVAAHQYHSELFRTLAAEHEAQGKAEGEADAVLTVLDANGVPVPQPAREAILACTDIDQLKTWLRRAVKATSIEDVLGT
jgi:hypothetical protein